MQVFWDKVSYRFVKLVNAFRYFDKNSNGRLCFNEFRVGTDNLGIKLTQTQLERVFKYMD